MSRKRSAFVIWLLIAVALIFAAWSTSVTAQGLATQANGLNANGPAAPSITYTVSVGGSGGCCVFDPTPVTITVNDKIHWLWSAFDHSTTSGACVGSVCTPDGKWDSQVQLAPFSYDVTFTQTGVYPYFCRIHGPLEGMRGTIIVVDSPIAGLAAASSSPANPGSPIAFSASITSGTNVTYTWDFGDNLRGSGQSTMHVYSLVGNYTATVTATNPINFAVASTRVVVENIPDVGIAKSVSPAQAVPGQSITYTLAFSNAGMAAATGVVITDLVPLSLTNVAFTSSGAAITATGGANYTWLAGDLVPGDGGRITITAKISPSLIGPSILTNKALIAANGVEADQTNDSASASVTVLARIFLPLISR